MTEKFTKWNAPEHLNTEKNDILHLDSCLTEDPGDGSLIRAALNDIPRVHGMSQLAATLA